MRPGAALLGSLVAAERRGRPGPAFAAARAAAAADPADAPAHLCDAVYALLVAGECKAATAALADLAPHAADPVIARRIAACRVWAGQLDGNWYPGDVGGEITDATSLPLPGPVGMGDPETVQLESCVAYGPIQLLSVRAVCDMLLRGNPAALAAPLSTWLATLAAFAPVDAAWAALAQADLQWRAGNADTAASALLAARAQAGHDPVALALTDLVEGDWYATPASSPEALGFDLAQQAAVSPLAALRDDHRAGTLYAHAARALGDADAPRMTGAHALRRAVLAWGVADYDAQRRWLGRARTAFELAGDASQLQVVTVHELLCDLARGEVAATRRDVGAGWDLAAHGPLAAVVQWASERGSSSFGGGLARLLQRAGEAFQASGKLDQASVAYSMAVPLARGRGGLLPSTLLEALARVDTAQNFTTRSLVRLEQALGALPDPPPLAQDPSSWLYQLGIVTAIMQAQSERAGTSTRRLGVDGLARSITQLQALLAVDGLPGPGAQPSSSDPFAAMLGSAADSGRGLLAEMQAILGIQRGRLLLLDGRTADADQAFTSTLAAIDASPPEEHWPGVLLCAVWQRIDEARRRLDAVRAAGTLYPDLLPMLALRAGDYATAAQLMGPEDLNATMAWGDRVNWVELDLGLGNHATALAQATTAIAQFEAEVGALARDPDRIAMCDDVNATLLYVYAARACLGLGQTAQSFLHGDRARSLALATLVRVTPDDDALRRRWQQAATVWSAAFERVLAAYETGGEETAAAQDLNAADATLGGIEAEIESRRPGTLAAARGLPPSPALADVQRCLPAGACLIQYHVVLRDLLTWVVTADAVRGVYTQLEPPGIEPLVSTAWAACAAGALGGAGDALAQILLGPVADELRACSRVVIVPFGPLTTVPFHALRFDGAPLGSTRTVSLLPAASLLPGRPFDAPLAGADALLVGDPAFDPDSEPGLPRLPGAAHEVAAIAQVWTDADVRVGAHATRRELDPLLIKRRIVHLAAHGELDDVAPSNSSIVLAGTDRLTVADLIGMRLGADLAVLSACNSGRGTATLGGDLIGLTRGLLAAGVRQVIVSLWPVDDLGACVTMRAFYEHLRESGIAAGALAAAQNEIRGLSADQLAARYAAEPPPPVRRGERNLGGDGDGSSSLDGSNERIWAPFIVVG